jgi:hypothetical protein
MSLHNIFDLFLPITNNDINEQITEEYIYEKIKEIRLHNIIRIGFEIIRGFSLVILKKEDKFFLHIFRKRFNKNYGNKDNNYWTNEGEYVSTIILNPKIKFPKKYDWLKIEPQNELIFKDNEIHLNGTPPKRKPNLEKMGLTSENLSITMNNLLEYNFRANMDNTNLLEPGEYGDLFDLDFYHELYNSDSGIEFNQADIRWQIFLRECVINYMGRNEPYILNYLRYTDFVKSNLKTSYFPYYENNSIYEVNITDNTCIECDICRKSVNEYYHNFVYGDLCENCYEMKKTTDINRIKNLKKIILLQGKRVIFQKDLEKTKDLLKTNKIIKPKKKIRDKILLNAFNSLKCSMKESTSQCGICFESLFNGKPVSSGTCGHCFHSKCLNNIVSDECPLCRETTFFYNLFL